MAICDILSALVERWADSTAGFRREEAYAIRLAAAG
jgi:hypothetical protein